MDRDGWLDSGDLGWSGLPAFARHVAGCRLLYLKIRGCETR